MLFIRNENNSLLWCCSTDSSYLTNNRPVADYLQIIAHLNAEHNVDLSAEVSTPKIRGNFKGSHTPRFEERNQTILTKLNRMGSIGPYFFQEEDRLKLLNPRCVKQ